MIAREEFKKTSESDPVSGAALLAIVRTNNPNRGRFAIVYRNTPEDELKTGYAFFGDNGLYDKDEVLYWTALNGSFLMSETWEY